MDLSSRFFTDTVTLALFDPERLIARIDAESDWWCGDFLELEEVQSGAIALVSLGGDGTYQVRITDGDLTPDERDYAVSEVRGLGVEVVSGKLFVGPAECIPGGGSEFTPAEAGRGLLLEAMNGEYDLDLFAIGWSHSPRWWSDDPTVVPDDAPADIVAVLRPRSTPFAGVDSDPLLDSSSDDYLFDSTTRRVGPEPGMILTTKVRRGPSNELCLKECGPLDYVASLVDYDEVAWKDTIRLRVLDVDHDAKQLTGEFVEKVEGQK